MRDYEDRWEKSTDNFDWFPVRYIGLLIIGAILFFSAVGAALWAMGVLTSGIYGRGEQIKQVNSAANRTFRYERFYALTQDIRAQAKQHQQAKEALDAFDQHHPGELSYSAGEERRQLELNEIGLSQQCTNNVETYNAEAQEFRTGAQFRSSNLPQSINEDACNNLAFLPPVLPGQDNNQ